MNRVIFLPIEDPNKLFFEIGENKILPNIHYVSYSVNKLNELNEKVKYFEDNPDEYKRIQNHILRGLLNLSSQFNLLLDFF